MSTYKLQKATDDLLPCSWLFLPTLATSAEAFPGQVLMPSPNGASNVSAMIISLADVNVSLLHSSDLFRRLLILTKLDLTVVLRLIGRINYIA